MNTIGIASGLVWAVAITGCQMSPCLESPKSDLMDEFSRLSECGSSIPATTAAQMPTSGTAIYSGVGILANSGPTPEGMIGDAVLTASFGAGTVNGAVTNMDSDVHGALTGQLTISGGTISGAAYTGATVTSTLTKSGGATFSTTATSDGAFGDTDSSLLFGLISGTGSWSDEAVAPYTIDGLVLTQQ